MKGILVILRDPSMKLRSKWKVIFVNSSSRLFRYTLSPPSPPPTPTPTRSHIKLWKKMQIAELSWVKTRKWNLFFEIEVSFNLFIKLHAQIIERENGGCIKWAGELFDAGRCFVKEEFNFSGMFLSTPCFSVWFVPLVFLPYGCFVS